MIAVVATNFAIDLVLSFHVMFCQQALSRISEVVLIMIFLQNNY